MRAALHQPVTACLARGTYGGAIDDGCAAWRGGFHPRGQWQQAVREVARAGS